MTRLRRKPWTAQFLQNREHVVLEPSAFRGRWREFFGNDKPVHAELGMGKGRFISEMSILYPDVNFIGIDMYDELLRKASEKALEARGIEVGPKGEIRSDVEARHLSNLAMALHNVQRIEDMFAPGELDRIYLNFSDPWPKKRHAKRRLTHPDFVRKYIRILKPDGEIHLKTDSALLFEFSLNSFSDLGLRLRRISLDVHRDGTPEGYVFTEYEQKFVEQGLPIYRCEALVPNS